MNILSKQNTTFLVSFDVEATRAVDELRPALAKVIEQLGTPVTKASELRRLLNLDQRLSWSVFNAATATDSRTLATLLPGPRAMERFFAAAMAQGAPEMTVERARGAFDRFQQTVAKHARSRETFETMIGELRGESEESVGMPDIDVKNRRAAFKGTALQWGRQTRLNVGALLVHPSSKPGLLDKVMVRGLVGLHRTRRGVPLHSFMHLWRTPYQGHEVAPLQLEPLDPSEAEPHMLGILPDFCSKPMPEFRPVSHESGGSGFEVFSEELGAAGEVNVFVGHVERAMTDWRAGALISVSPGFTIPTQTAVIDVFMHKSVWDERLPDVKVYAWPVHGTMQFYDIDLVPQRERAIYLGMGLSAAHTLEIPQYGEMLSYAAERMGWNPAEFRAFRCRVEFPLLYTRVRTTFYHPETDRATSKFQ